MSTEEVRESLTAHGHRYLERIFTRRELAQCGADPRRLAGRFAAKEAAMKVLRTADEPLPWRAIAVHAEPGGGLAITLSGDAAALAERRGFDRLSVSVAHRRSIAAAIVLGQERSV